MPSTLTIIFLLAAIQGFLLTVLLFTRRQNHVANVVLGVFVGMLSLDLLQSVYYLTGAYVNAPHLMGMTFTFPFIYGPLFYLYVRLLTRELDRLTWPATWHFLPAAMVFVVLLPVYAMSGGEKVEYVRLLETSRPELFSVLNDILPFYGLIYTILATRVIARHNTRIRHSFSNIDRINLVWLRSLTMGVAVTWSIVIVGTIISHVAPEFWANTTGQLVNVSISILVYAIGYLGLNQPEIFRPPAAEAPVAEAPSVVAETAGRYARSGLNGSTADMIFSKLRASMETQRLFLDGDLTLSKLAESLSAPSHHVSQVMNERCGQNFYDFVNSYRVEEVKRRLLKGDAGTFNILSIAYDAGFTSKTSFNTVFKKHTGVSPSQFLERNASPPLTPTSEQGPSGSAE